MHQEAHEKAGQIVNLKEGTDLFDAPSGQEYDASIYPVVIEDWWDRVSGRSWKLQTERNPAAANYQVRAEMIGLPRDDEVVYAKQIRDGEATYGHLIHVTELDY